MILHSRPILSIASDSEDDGTLLHHEGGQYNLQTSFTSDICHRHDSHDSVTAYQIEHFTKMAACC